MGRKTEAPRQTEQLDQSLNTSTHHAVRVTLQEGDHTLQWVRVEQHVWSDWELVQDCDCTREGEEHRVCAVCGGVQYRRLGPHGHIIRSTNLCDKSSGKPVFECIVCGVLLCSGRVWQLQNTRELGEEPKK